MTQFLELLGLEALKMGWDAAVSLLCSSLLLKLILYACEFFERDEIQQTNM